MTVGSGLAGAASPVIISLYSSKTNPGPELEEAEWAGNEKRAPLFCSFLAELTICRYAAHPNWGNTEKAGGVWHQILDFPEIELLETQKFAKSHSLWGGRNDSRWEHFLFNLHRRKIFCAGSWWWLRFWPRLSWMRLGGSQVPGPRSLYPGKPPGKLLSCCLILVCAKFPNSGN